MTEVYKYFFNIASDNIPLLNNSIGFNAGPKNP